MSRHLISLLCAVVYFCGSMVLPSTVLHAQPEWTPTVGLYFREDTEDIPPSKPITQKHVSHPDLTMRLHGVAEKQLKKSYHEGNANDPHYIWSGRCKDRWAVSWRKTGSAADLSGPGAFFRMRTKNYDRTLYPMVRTEQGWFVADEGASASEDWTVQVINVDHLNWHPLTSSIRREEQSVQVDLNAVKEVGVTDLKRGEGSGACSRLDWIEVWTSPPDRPVYAVRAVDGYQVYDGKQPVLFYHTGTNTWKNNWARSNYIHPVNGLNGQVLTEDFPEDHPYHRGLFWAWQQVFVNGERVGDAWHLQKVQRTVQQVKVHRHRSSVELESIVHWTVPSYREGKKPFLRERVIIRVLPRKKDHRLIELKIALQALAESVRIGGADNDKELGGLGVRLDVPDDLRFTSPEGEVSARRTPVAEAPWCTFTGSFGGGPRSNVTVMTHPDTPGFPPRWILRDRPSMQNPVFPGRNPVQVPSRRQLKLRYGLVIHEGGQGHTLYERYTR